MAVAARVAEQLEDPLAELVGVELTGVEDDVGLRPQRLEHHPFAGDRLLDAAGRQRVAAPRPLEPAHEDVVGRVEEEDPDAGARRLRRSFSTGERSSSRSPPPPADDERDPVAAGAGTADEAGDVGDQRDRQVVDDEPAEVLERRAGRRPAGAGHPGDDEQLTHGRPSALGRLALGRLVGRLAWAAGRWTASRWAARRPPVRTDSPCSRA